MKKCLLVCAALLLCAGLLLPGCAGAAETPEEAVLTPTQSPAPTQEPVSPAPSMLSPAENAKSPLARIDEQEEAMKAFLLEHQTEMEELVAVMMEYSSSSNDYEYEYDVREKTVFVYHPNYYRAKAFYTDHPIIDKASILDDTLFHYVYVDFESPIVDTDACCFVAHVHDENDVFYCRIWLFYCEEEPTEKEFYPLDPVIPHWYFFVEWLE